MKDVQPAQMETRDTQFLLKVTQQVSHRSRSRPHTFYTLWVSSHHSSNTPRPQDHFYFPLRMLYNLYTTCFQLKKKRKKRNLLLESMTTYIILKVKKKKKPTPPTFNTDLCCIGKYKQTKRVIISSKFRRGLWNVNRLGNRLGWCHEVVINLFFP